MFCFFFFLATQESAAALLQRCVAAKWRDYHDSPEIKQFSKHHQGCGFIFCSVLTACSTAELCAGSDVELISVKMLPAAAGDGPDLIVAVQMSNKPKRMRHRRSAIPTVSETRVARRRSRRCVAGRASPSDTTYGECANADIWAPRNSLALSCKRGSVAP